ncbi:MAG: zinc transport system permease protein, partial [Actinomycetota bacterium]|nr:zinc transport system permease protein [Actinomycetota bacterium]
MPWPFERDYMQLALVAGVVVGACAPLIGVFLVQRRLSLMGDGIGHIAFAGVGIGAIVGVWPV